jgi:hypothetical protein
VLASLSLVLWVSLLRLPGFVSGPGLDQSWQQCLAYFFRHRLQAGTDYIFSYGPLGYFATTAYDPDLFWPRYAWELVLTLLMVLAFVRIAWRLPHFALQVLFFGLAIAFLPPFPDASQTLFILVLGLLPFVEGRLRATYLVPGTLVLALLGLTKSTLLVLALGAVTALSLHFLLSGHRLRALAPGALFALFFVLAWALLGQSLAHLPVYLVGCWQIIAGYGEAMATEGAVSETFLALGTLLLLSTAVLQQGRALGRRPHTLVATAFLAGTVFIAWKHGFVRHDDGHAPIFFAVAVLVPFVLHALHPAPAHSPAWAALLGGSVALALLGFSYWHGLLLSVLLLLAPCALRSVVFSRPGDRPQRYALTAAAVLLALLAQWALDDWLGLSRCWERFRSSATAALAPQARRADREAQAAGRRDYWGLPQTRATVGEASIDLFGNSQGVVLLTGLNYQPRPVFQSYTAYTSYLAAANARYYGGPDAPAYALLRLEPIDSRLTPAEDGAALLELLRRYRPVLTEKAYVLLRRTGPPAAARPPAKQTVVERAIRIGEEVRLDDLPGRYQTACLRFERTLCGQVELALYKLRALDVQLQLEGGRSRRFRLIPGMVGEPFLLNPLLEDKDDVLDLYRGAPGKRVVSLRILPPEENWASWESYRPEVRLTVYGLEELPCPESGGPGSAELK